MTEPFGKYLRLRVEGASRSPDISCVLTGFPAGVPVPKEELQAFLARRAPGQNPWSTARREPDVPEIVSGVTDGVTDGNPIEIRIPNTDAEKTDAVDYAVTPRPSHADFAAVQKYGNAVDLRGGGHFSGRLTAPFCAAGFFALQYLQMRGIEVFAHLFSVGSVKDAPVHPLHPDTAALRAVRQAAFPAVSSEAAERMQKAVLSAKEQGDSLGGIIECIVTGLPAGAGEHMFRSAEAAVSDAVFAVPGVKGIEFGDGFSAALHTGSENNDGYRTDGTLVFPESNHAGGVLGGMTSGAPLVFRVACKPTPSVARPQHTVNLLTKQNADIAVRGRNDPCYAPRAVPAVEAAAALALCDLLLSERTGTESLDEYRRRIDNADAAVADAFSVRMDASLRIGALKQKEAAAVYQPARESAVLENVLRRTAPAFRAEAEHLYRGILRTSKAAQKQHRSLPFSGYSEKHFLLIGHPLGHSLSGRIHSRLADYRYTLLDLPDEALPELFSRRDFDGMNVTVPYKKAVLPYLHSLSEEAAAVGAVNTVVKDKNGNLRGFNTDIPGFDAMLDRIPGISRLQKAVLLGNGGAAAAVRYVLKKRGFTEIQTVTRNDRDTLRFDSLPDAALTGALLVNCTPCGMYPEEGASLLTDRQVGLCAAVADLVYNPLRTRLLQQAEKAGLPCANGLSMLVSQAVAAASLFCGVGAPAGLASALTEELTEDTSNLLLIGMPGCGKSATAARIAEITGRRLFDTDADLTERTGYTPADYLRRFGEDAFRAEEAISVRTASHLRGAVIATGGGAVLREENRYRLRASGKVYYLDRPSEALDLTYRPLSAGNGVKALYAERHPLYLETADAVIPVTDLRNTAESVLSDFTGSPCGRTGKKGEHE